MQWLTKDDWFLAKLRDSQSSNTLNFPGVCPLDSSSGFAPRSSDEKAPQPFTDSIWNTKRCYDQVLGKNCQGVQIYVIFTPDCVTKLVHIVVRFL